MNIYDIICYIFGHKMKTNMTQPNNMSIEWCIRCGKFKSFLNSLNARRAFYP